MTCGVYKISFSNTDKVYIGSSKDIDRAISMIEELENLVHDLRLDNESLKQEILQLEAMIDD